MAPNEHVDLATLDPRSTPAAPGHELVTERAAGALATRLAELQHRLWAEHRRSVLVVLQAMDAGGKDGTIRKVFSGVNPLGVEVTSFRAPTEEERDHDFLWRVHRRAPARGRLGIFNRSHYEDVVTVRVHRGAEEPVWRARYGQIRAFEELLAAEGTTVVKFLLHISKEEQAERLRSRLERPDKRWKFRLGDLDDRERWDDFMAAYGDAVSETSTPSAPWYVVPADRKWYRNWAVLAILVETLEELDPRFPEAAADLDGVVVE
ncbi:MAG TPA: PPK2 family polyphosphate kinase [Acidimicrobiales bacterium]|nr:PPK2 family polyphosphate kinase [Acidimicrobiales bacterium]